MCIRDSTIRNAYLGLLQRWVTQQVTDQQFRLETEATVSMMLAGIAKKTADRKHWHDQFIRTQARLLKVSTLDQRRILKLSPNFALGNDGADIS